LARRIKAARERGRDRRRFVELLDQMVSIAVGEPDDVEPAAREAAGQWLWVNDGGVRKDAFRWWLWEHPEVIVAAIRTLRATAQNPTTSARCHRKAAAVLAQIGYDDASLRAEDATSRD
jgi:hypothetical protein